MKTDIEIAQETKMLPIKDVAAQYSMESIKPRSPMNSGMRSGKDPMGNWC